jgi:N-glycosylase/DNA lyase
MLSAGSNVSPHRATILIPRSALNLAATLDSGQTFAWEQLAPAHWQGWVGQVWCEVREEQDAYQCGGVGLTAAAVRDYFQLDFPLATAIKSFPVDAALTQALAYAPGLRILRQPAWETLANFICSSVKQITQIKAIHQELRRRFGQGQEHRLFPSPAVLSEAGEMALRECKLGFRARHLYRTALRIAESGEDLETWHRLTTEELKARLIALPGVGEKIANCVLLFAYNRYEVFPIDVWVERVLKEIYFTKARRKTPERLRAFAQDYFGPYRGYAQQYLFHWIRTAGEKS